LGNLVNKPLVLAAVFGMSAFAIAAFAEDDSVGVSKNDSGAPGLAWDLTLTGRADTVTIKNVVVNRGNCKGQWPPRLPQTLKFGETHLYDEYLCDPIEVEVTTDKGSSTFKWDAFTQDSLSVSKNESAPNVWELVFTGRADSLTIENVVVNRGHCQTRDSAGHIPQPLKFGQRYKSINLCNPIEVQVTTDQGSATFTWSQ
jgi:hypothetical protein